MKPAQSLYESVTASVLAGVTEANGQFQMPWHRTGGKTLTMPLNATTKSTYRGINILLLWIAALQGGYEQSEWASYKQWASIGAQVRAKEHGTKIVFYKQFEIEAETDDDNGQRRVAKSYSVFSADQVDGYSGNMQPSVDHGPIERLAAFDRLVNATGVTILHGGTRAFYSPATDEITLPDEWRWSGTNTRDRHESYASVTLHELGHWSGHRSRLDRRLFEKWGKHEAACEEVIAELTAAFLCAELGYSAEPRPDHARYLSGYIALLKDNNRAIFVAAAAAA